MLRCFFFYVPSFFILFLMRPLENEIKSFFLKKKIIYVDVVKSNLGVNHKTCDKCNEFFFKKIISFYNIHTYFFWLQLISDRWTEHQQNHLHIFFTVHATRDDLCKKNQRVNIFFMPKTNS